MENSVEIWVEVNGEKRLLDVYEQEVISLNYSLADIQDISKRNTSFSKTISLPDSKSNREAFEFISELNADSLFNQNLKTSCWIYCNSLLIFRGNLQLKKVNTDYSTDITSLEVVVYGETETFISSMGERYLRDLDLSYLDHTWNYDSIAYSWTQSWEHGYFYPLMDNGMNYTEENIGKTGSDGFSLINYDKGKGVQILNMKPAVYVRTILDRLFIDNGFSYRSDFFDSEYFKKLIIPHNGKIIYQGDSVYDYVFQVGLTSSDGYFSAGNWNTVNSNDNRINYIDEITDLNDVYQLGPTYSFVMPDETFKVSFGGKFVVNCLLAASISSFSTINNVIFGSGSSFYDCNISVRYRRNGSIYIEDNVPVEGNYTSYSNSGTLLFANRWFGLITEQRPTIQYRRPDSNVEFIFSGDKLYASFSCILNTDLLDNRYDVSTGKYFIPFTGEKIDVIIHMDYNLEPNPFITNASIFQSPTGGELLLGGNSTFYNGIDSSLLPGGVMNVSSSLSNKFKQKDFFKGLVTMFNLFVEPDPINNKLLNIEPRNDYYDGGSNLDWTNKVDVSSIDFSFISDYQSKKTLLTYKADGDYVNKTYTLQTEEIYGQYLETFNNDFISNENKIESSFSPTPIIALPGTGGFPMSKICKNENGELYESNLRVLFRNYLPLEGSKNYWVIYSLTQSQNIEYSYPWAGHLDHPYRPTQDLNFGQVYTSGYNWPITYNNLSELYYRNYLDLINDTNSRFLTAKFYLNESDISNLSFKDTIFLNLNGRPMKFLINKISNYNPIMPSLCDVELIKIK